MGGASRCQSGCEAWPLLAHEEEEEVADLQSAAPLVLFQVLTRFSRQESCSVCCCCLLRLMVFFSL